MKAISIGGTAWAEDSSACIVSEKKKTVDPYHIDGDKTIYITKKGKRVVTNG